MGKVNRRTFIKNSAITGALGLFAAPTHAKTPTPREAEGPFYPVFTQKDRDFDLTLVNGKNGGAKGKVISIEGQVLDTEGSAIEDATVDLWQANAIGRYRHPHDSNTAALDPNFQGWAIVQSGKNGLFRFKTILPGAYPASANWIRPPHIHFKISKKGYIEITTQMYFPGQELNKSDLLLKRKSKKNRELMIATEVHGKADTYKYNIVLEKV